MSELEWKWCDFTAGWVAGIAGIVIGHPMDTIKVRQQTLRGVRGLDIAKNTLKYEGIRGFYKGMMFPALTAGMLNSIFFGVYGNTLSTLQTFRGDDYRRTCAEGVTPVHKYWHFDVYMAGCVAGLAQVFVGCPVDMIKIQLQSQTGTEAFHWAKHYEAGYKGPVDCLKSIYRESGIRGFYRGFGCMVCRDIIASPVYMLVYEELCANTSPTKDFLTVFVAGGVAGTISWQLVIPLDVVKSRLQADNNKKPEYKGFMDCIVKSYRKDGIGVFGKGFWMISLRAFAVNSGVFVAFEWILYLCSKATVVIPPAVK